MPETIKPLVQEQTDHRIYDAEIVYQEQDVSPQTAMPDIVDAEVVEDAPRPFDARQEAGNLNNYLTAIEQSVSAGGQPSEADKAMLSDFNKRIRTETIVVSPGQSWGDVEIPDTTETRYSMWFKDDAGEQVTTDISPDFAQRLRAFTDTYKPEQNSSPEDTSDADLPKPGELGAEADRILRKLNGIDQNTPDSQRPKPKSRKNIPDGTETTDVLIPASNRRKATTISAEEAKNAQQPKPAELPAFTSLEQLESLITFTTDPETGRQVPQKVKGRNLREIDLVKQLERKYAGPGKSISQLAAEGWKWQVTPEEAAANAAFVDSIKGKEKNSRLRRSIRSIGATAAFGAGVVKTGVNMSLKDTAQLIKKSGAAIQNGVRTADAASEWLMNNVPGSGYRLLERYNVPERWRQSKYRVRSLGRSALAGFDPSMLVDRDQQYNSYEAGQRISAAAFEPEATPKQKRKAAARDEELRQVAAGKRTGQFIVGTDGQALYESQ